MRIKFTKDWQFAENGHTLTDFVAGQEHDVSESCADSALQEGVAGPVSRDTAKSAPSNKNKGSATDNK